MSDDKITGPNAKALRCRQRSIELRAEIATMTDPDERKAGLERLRMVRGLERWSKTRAGYEKPGR